MTRIRPLILAILAVLVQTGVVPPEVAVAIQYSPTEMLAGTLLLWAGVAAWRNWKAARFAQEGAGHESR